MQQRVALIILIFGSEIPYFSSEKKNNILWKMEKETSLLESSEIQSKIYTIRDLQVMLDSDLAELYQVETKNLNRAVKRNIERFPDQFMFQLTKDEFENLRYHFGTSNDEQSLRFQFGTLENNRGKHRKYLPYVFTEQGVSMLSAVLKSDIAIQISIQIINAFVNMRKFIAHNAMIFQRLDKIEQKQLVTDLKLEKVFEAIEAKQIKPKQGIFYNGQIFDAYVFVSDLLKSAKSSIVLIDNYIDETVLALLSKRSKGCKAQIYTSKISNKLQLDLEKHNQQYPSIEIKIFKDSHDRFLILDEKEIYHIGASLKDLGKKWFAFSKFEQGALELLGKLGDK